MNYKKHSHARLKYTPNDKAYKINKKRISSGRVLHIIQETPESEKESSLQESYIHESIDEPVGPGQTYKQISK